MNQFIARPFPVASAVCGGINRRLRSAALVQRQPDHGPVYGPMTAMQLRAEVSLRRIKGRSKVRRKVDLITLLMAHDQEMLRGGSINGMGQ